MVSIATCPVLAPIKLTISLSGIVFAYLSSYILTKNINIQKPLHPFRRSVLQTTFRISGRMFAFGLGFFHIREVNKQFKPDLEKCHVCISNHVSSLDPAAYISLGFQSFISKEEVKHIPCIGATCWANQGLFV